MLAPMPDMNMPMPYDSGSNLQITHENIDIDADVDQVDLGGMGHEINFDNLGSIDKGKQVIND